MSLSLRNILSSSEKGERPAAVNTQALPKGEQSKTIVRHAAKPTSGRLRTHELCGVVVQLRAGVQYTTCLELLAGKLKSLQLARRLMRRAMHFVTKTCTLDNDRTLHTAHGLKR